MLSGSPQIESRLDELRAAEEAFLRTRRELADHTDAIAAREQLLAQRERELDEREDGWGGPDMRELESRLRRLETQRTAIGRTQELQRRVPPARAGRRPPAAVGVSRAGTRLYTETTRGVSSVGRAPALQAGGRRFEPGTLHPANGLNKRFAGSIEGSDRSEPSRFGLQVRSSQIRLAPKAASIESRTSSSPRACSNSCA